MNQKNIFILSFVIWFGNNLISSLSQSSKFLLNLEGMSDNCQSDSISGIINSSIPLNVLQLEPYNDGIYTIYYDPSITGDLPFCA
jgi:hypothetical protein